MESGHPLYCLFHEHLAGSFEESFGRSVEPRVHDYVTSLLFSFMRSDDLFSLKDSEGRVTTSVIEMVAAGDVLLGAQSFEEERRVHKHIGDYILFWSGVNPRFLEQNAVAPLARPDYAHQGMASYRIAASFDHPPHDLEAPVLEFLSEEFVGVAEALRRFSHRFPLAS